MAQTQGDTYGLDSRFERVVAVLASSRPRFYGRLGHEVEPEGFADPTARLVLEAVHAIARERGQGPSSPVIVVQRLLRMVDDGAITIEQVRKASDMYDDVEDAGIPSEEDVANELTPILQQRLRDAAVREGIAAAGKKKGLERVVALEQRASRIGVVDTSIGTMLGDDGFSEIRKLKDLERLPTGIVELDFELSGGLQRSGLGMFLGASGDGKSMGLTHVSGTSICNGLFAAYASLEVPKPIVLARLTANLTGIPINTILDDAREARRRLDMMGETGRMGRFVVQDFTPHVTTVEDLKEWIDQVEDHAGRAVDLVVVDYADKLGVRVARGSKSDSEYREGRIVYEGLRIWSVEAKKFTWTASQASRQKKGTGGAGGPKLDLNDTADSMHKVRVADLVVTLNLRDDGETMLFYIAKHRTGKSRVEVGPLPVEFSLGRIAPVLASANGMIAL